MKGEGGRERRSKRGLYSKEARKEGSGVCDKRAKIIGTISYRESEGWKQKAQTRNAGP